MVSHLVCHFYYLNNVWRFCEVFSMVWRDTHFYFSMDHHASPLKTRVKLFSQLTWRLGTYLEFSYGEVCMDFPSWFNKIVGVGSLKLTKAKNIFCYISLGLTIIFLKLFATHSEKLLSIRNSSFSMFIVAGIRQNCIETRFKKCKINMLGFIWDWNRNLKYRHLCVVNDASFRRPYSHQSLQR